MLVVDSTADEEGLGLGGSWDSFASLLFFSGDTMRGFVDSALLLSPVGTVRCACEDTASDSDLMGEFSPPPDVDGGVSTELRIPKTSAAKFWLRLRRGTLIKDGPTSLTGGVSRDGDLDKAKLLLLTEGGSLA